MTTNTPVDPDKLRAALTRAVEPVKPSPDALPVIRAGVRRRRRLTWSVGSGAGVLALGGAAAAVAVIASAGHPEARTVTVTPGGSTSVSVAPSTAAATTTSASTTRAVPPSSVASVSGVAVAPAAPSASAPVAVATTAAVQAPPTPPTAAVTAPTSKPAPTTTPATPPHVADDVDGDGKPDTVSTPALSATTARLVLHLSTGATVDGPAIARVQQFNNAGRVSFGDVNGDGRSEIFVTAGGADGTAFRLFQYVGSSLVEVPPPVGTTAPYLYSGGGGQNRFSFACTGTELVVTRFLNSFTDPTHGTFSVARYTLSGGRLTRVSGTTSTVTTTHGDALAAAQPDNRCGAPQM